VADYATRRATSRRASPRRSIERCEIDRSIEVAIGRSGESIAPRGWRRPCNRAGRTATKETTMRQLSGLLAALLPLALGAAACDGVADDTTIAGEEYALDDDDAVDTQYFYERFFYGPPQPTTTPLPMGSSLQRACFLTGTEGNYEGSGEWIHSRLTGNGSAWELAGDTDVHNVKLYGAANCIKGSYTAEVGWVESMGNNVEVPMGVSASTHTCFLTEVQGRFEGSGELVHVKLNGANNWVITGTSAQNGLGAMARCLARPASQSTRFEWHKWYTSATKMEPITTHKCFLTRVQGEFDYQPGDSLLVLVGADGYWYLGGGDTDSSSRMAEARCIPKIPPIVGL
jgi:hypothetical protein